MGSLAEEPAIQEDEITVLVTGFGVSDFPDLPRHCRVLMGIPSTCSQRLFARR